MLVHQNYFKVPSTCRKFANSPQTKPHLALPFSASSPPPCWPDKVFAGCVCASHTQSLTTHTHTSSNEPRIIRAQRGHACTESARTRDVVSQRVSRKNVEVEEPARDFQNPSSRHPHMWRPWYVSAGGFLGGHRCNTGARAARAHIRRFECADEKWRMQRGRAQCSIGGCVCARSTQLHKVYADTHTQCGSKLRRNSETPSASRKDVRLLCRGPHVTKQMVANTRTTRIPEKGDTTIYIFTQWYFPCAPVCMYSKTAISRSAITIHLQFIS